PLVRRLRPGVAVDAAGPGHAGRQGPARTQAPPRRACRAGTRQGRVEMSITVQGVSKRFGQFQALKDVSVEAESGSLLALLGPSGSGKTTLLRIIAGLEAADAGQVLAHDENVTHRSVRERNVGFVFQHYALFRHLTVFENVAFGLRVRGWSNAAVQAQ